MKKIIFLLCIISICLNSTGQTKKTTVPVKSIKSVPPVLLKSAIDSFSYAVGLSIANFYKEQGVKSINQTLVMKALNDVKAGKPLLNDEQTNNCIVTYMQEVRSEKASGNKKAGDAFLAENKKKPGIIETATGLQYQVVREGTGARPTADDKVKVHYEGTLLDGTIFDSSIKRGEPISFDLKGVIPGWTEALQLMTVGSKWKLFIPSNLAYGDNQAGPEIKPGSTLVFELELLEIVK